MSDRRLATFKVLALVMLGLWLVSTASYSFFEYDRVYGYKRLCTVVRQPDGDLATRWGTACSLAKRKFRPSPARPPIVVPSIQAWPGP